jgi:peptide subunit release factor 1 (eRF1)
MRLVNAIPALKQKMIKQQMRLREAEQIKASLEASSADSNLPVYGAETARKVLELQS